MDLSPLQDIFANSGPFLTIHAEIGRNSEDADQQLEARWTTIRHHLESAQLDADLTGDIEQRFRENPHVPGEARLTMVAADGRVVFQDVHAGRSTAPETTTVGPLPDLSGWLRQADSQLPFVLAVADRQGADIDIYRALSAPDHEHKQVTGETFHITKVSQGEWSEQRIQQNVENQWVQNAREVADEITSAVRAHRPAAVLLAGEPRARSEVAHALDGLQTPLVQLESGGRAAGSSEEALWSEVRAALGRVEAERDSATVEELLERSGQGSRAARGLHDVLDALVQGRVEHLVLDLGAAAEMEVHPADHPGLDLPAAALKADSLPADQVLVAVGASTRAELSVLPAAATKGAGVAALLRWDQ